MIKKINLLSTIKTAISCLVVGIALTSCMGDDDIKNTPQTPMAAMSVFHASPDAPGLDIYLDDQKINSNAFKYLQGSGYAYFASGNRRLTLKSTGTATVLLDTTVSLITNSYYSLFFVDKAAKLKAMLVKDDTEPATGTNAKIRLINLSPDAPAFTVSKNTDTTPLVSADGFRQVTEFRELASGAYSFTIRDAQTSESLTLVTTKKIEAGTYYTLITRGYVDAGSTTPFGVEFIVNQ